MVETKRLTWFSRLLSGGNGKPRLPEKVHEPQPLPAVQAVEIQPSELGAALLSSAVPPTPARYVLPPAIIERTPTLDLTVLPAAPPVEMRVLVHVSMRGDVEAALNMWAGERGSGLRLEGFALTVISGIKPDDVEYQALLDDGTITNWHRGETYCGTRGASRPLRGFALRLVRDAALAYRISYAAVSLDGSEVGPSADGALCATDSEAGLEAIYVMVEPSTDSWAH